MASADEPILDLSNLESLKEDPICERVALNVQRLRGKCHLSPDALARQCAVSRATLAQIESGRSVPSIKVLCMIAKGMKVSLAAFLDHRAFEGIAVLSVSQSKRQRCGCQPDIVPVRHGRVSPSVSPNFMNCA